MPLAPVIVASEICRDKNHNWSCFALCSSDFMCHPVYRQVIMFRFRLYSCWWEQWYPFCLRWWRATKWWCICWAGFRRRSQDCSVEESQAHGQEIHWWSVNGVQIGPVMFQHTSYTIARKKNDQNCDRRDTLNYLLNHGLVVCYYLELFLCKLYQDVIYWEIF